MGRVGACSLSGCRMAAMRRLLGLLVCMPVASYSQWATPRESCYWDGEYHRCPSRAPDCYDAKGLCYYHYGKGCDMCLQSGYRIHMPSDPRMPSAPCSSSKTSQKYMERGWPELRRQVCNAGWVWWWL